MKPPLVITGIGRSGTTLLQSMLNAHPDVAFTPETHFLKYFVVPELAGRGKGKWDKERLIEAMKGEEGMQRLGWELGAWLDEHLEEGPDRLRKLYRRILEEWAESKAASHAGDKDPLSIEYLPHLACALPDAYVIHIIRDPRDVQLSRVRSGWGKGRPLLAHICEHRTLFPKARKDGPRYFGERYIELHYEDLLRDPEGSLKWLCERLPVDYVPAMLEYETSAGELVHEGEDSWKKNVMGPLLQKNVGKWKREMSRSQLRTVESNMRATLQEGAYEESGAYSAFLRLLHAFPLYCCSLLFRIKFRIQRVRVDG